MLKNEFFCHLKLIAMLEVRHAIGALIKLDTLINILILNKKKDLIIGWTNITYKSHWEKLLK